MAVPLTLAGNWQKALAPKMQLMLPVSCAGPISDRFAKLLRLKPKTLEWMNGPGGQGGVGQGWGAELIFTKAPSSARLGGAGTGPAVNGGNANNHQHWLSVYCGHEIQINESLQVPGTDAIKTGSAYGFANLNAKQARTYTEDYVQENPWRAKGSFTGLPR